MAPESRKSAAAGSGGAGKISVYGWDGCPYFARASARATGIEDGNAEVKSFPHRDAYQEWLKENTPRFGPKAQGWTSCPFTFVDGDKFIGGHDDFMAFAKATYGETPGGASNITDEGKQKRLKGAAAILSVGVAIAVAIKLYLPDRSPLWRLAGAPLIIVGCIVGMQVPMCT